MAKKPETPAPCPFCERPEVGLNCPNAECARRVAKNMDEPTPLVPSTCWPQGRSGNRKSGTITGSAKAYHGQGVEI